MPPKLSIIVPLYNEAELVNEFYGRVSATMREMAASYELIFVDDGSVDSTFDLLTLVQKHDPAVKIIRLARNFGHQSAISAGLESARGDVVAMIDGDLQDPPELIPRMIATLEQGYDVVYGVRKARKEGWLKVTAYWAFYRLLQTVARIDIPLDAGDFCVMNRQVVNALISLPERNRFIRGLRSWVGFRQTGLEYPRSARLAGEPKYTLRKLMRLALDGFIAFSDAPLRLAAYLGLAVSASSFVGILVVLYFRLFTDQSLPGFASVAVLMLFLGGTQLLSVGLAGEYLGRIYDEVKHRPLYVIRQTVGWTNADEDPMRQGERDLNSLPNQSSVPTEVNNLSSASVSSDSHNAPLADKTKPEDSADQTQSLDQNSKASSGPVGRRFTRLIPSIALLSVMLMACATHAYRHFNLSGDEVFFYFLGSRAAWSDYRTYYEPVRLQIDSKAHEPELTETERSNVTDTEFYLGVQPDTFGEYRLPVFLWGIVSTLVAPSKIMIQSDEALSRGIADSIFFMMLACSLAAYIAVAIIMHRLSGLAKAALLIFFVGIFIRESFFGVSADAFYRTFPLPVAAFLSMMLTDFKDFMVFSFSSRSHFLVLLPAFLACRWDLTRKTGISYTPYLLMVILALIHSSQAVLLAGIFLVIDAVLYRQRLKHPAVLLTYAATFGVGMGGGSATTEPLVLAGLLLATTVLVVTAAFLGWRPVASSSKTEQEKAFPVMHWRRDVLALGLLAAVFLLVATQLMRSLQGADLRWLITLCMRLGMMFGVMFGFSLSWLVMDFAYQRVKPGIKSSLRAGAATTLAPVLVAVLVAVTHLSIDLRDVRTRLRIQSAGYLELSNKPLSFNENNGLHIIWMSIIKSVIHNKSYVVQVNSRLGQPVQ
jgi:dolichol-phosphate mannosyltransferase